MDVEIPKRALAIISLALAPFAFTLAQMLSEPQGSAGPPTSGAAFSASQLQSLVAPIALYPDPLVAQILTAATYPDQVAAADAWYAQNVQTAGSELMVAVDAQPWDPSVKALTQFPSVLHNMAGNLSWTSELGDAYHSQTAAVMSAIQNLRAQAQAAGNLSSGQQITVVQQSPDVIVIQPANPQVVYVPVYDPAVVYGTVYVVPAYAYVPPPPLYSSGALVAAGVIGFAAGVAIASSHSSCCVWGYSSWNCGWHGTTTVVYHGTTYPPNTAWHGSYYNGSYHSTYSYNSPYGHATSTTTYNPSTGQYGHAGGTTTYNSSTNSYTHDSYNTATDTTHSSTYNASTGQTSKTTDTYNPSTHTTTSSTSYNQYNKPSSTPTYNDENYHPSSSSSYDGSSTAHPSSSGSSWASDSGSHSSSAYGGSSGHSDGYGGSGGWSSNAESSRGWGSMHSSGYSGGRFGGGGSGGGGFRR